MQNAFSRRKGVICLWWMEQVWSLNYNVKAIEAPKGCRLSLVRIL